MNELGHTVTNAIGSVTSYFDLGAVTNFPSRFYRVRLLPQGINATAPSASNRKWSFEQLRFGLTSGSVGKILRGGRGAQHITPTIALQTR